MDQIKAPFQPDRSEKKLKENEIEEVKHHKQ